MYDVLADPTLHEEALARTSRARDRGNSGGGARAVGGWFRGGKG